MLFFKLIAKINQIYYALKITIFLNLFINIFIKFFDFLRFYLFEINLLFHDKLKKIED
jgi:hypothetical protein